MSEHHAQGQDRRATAGIVDKHIRYRSDVRTLYLAGKVSMDNDWRERLVEYDPAYCGALQTDPGHAHKFRVGGIVYDANCSHFSPDFGAQHWGVRRNAIFGRYDYTGPYVSDMDHDQNGFSYGPSIATNEEWHAFVRDECEKAIQRSDVVFAWLDDVTAYATFAEIGYAKALGKRVWIAGPSEFAELWFVYGWTDRVQFGAADPVRALFKLLTVIETSVVGDDHGGRGNDEV